MLEVEKMEKDKKTPAKIYPFYPNGQFYFERVWKRFVIKELKKQSGI